jgi:gamma-glutamyltranspeptidase/glutathione hydrolase
MASSSKYKPVEVASDGYSSGEEGDGSAERSSVGAALKLGAAVVVGLVIGLLLGGGGDGCSSAAEPASGSPMRCGGPVEGPERHLTPWDTLPKEMTNGGGDRGVGKPFAGRSAVLGQRGMAATSQPLVSMVATDIMKRGGSAIDAAVAANLMQGLVEPMSNGIGGDVFAIIWDPKKKKLVGYNGSGRSSKRFSLEQMREASARVAASGSDGEATGDDDGQVETYIPGQGPLSVTVPGAVQGFCDMHAKYGKLPWADLFGPAIEYALRGYPVTEYIADQYARGWGAGVSTDDGCNVQKTLGGQHPHACDGFYNTFTKGKSSAPGNQGPVYGELFRNPELAETYTAMRDEGCHAFYNGSVARKIFASGWAESVGLPLTQEDFSSHHGEWIHENRSAGYRLLNTSYKGRYRECNVHTMRFLF